MDRRIGIAMMALAAVGGLATVAALGTQHGWGTMPPLVPVFLLLLVAAPALAWFRLDALAWTGVLLLLFGVGLFGLSTGFLVWAAMGSLAGMLVTSLGGRQPQVPA